MSMKTSGGPESSGRLVVRIAGKRFVSADGAALQAIENLSFTVEPETFTVLVGPSGCGKTTTLRIILGLDRDFEGEVRRPVPATRIAAVFQEPRLLPWRDVETNVRLALTPELEGLDLRALFETLGLAGLERLYPGELSLGLARRVALARAFAIRPSLIVLDEPFVSLDEATAARLRALLIEVWLGHKASAVMVTHNLREALDLADRIVFLNARPATVRGVVDIETPRIARTPLWREAMLADVEQRFPGIG